MTTDDHYKQIYHLVEIKDICKNSWVYVFFILILLPHMERQFSLAFSKHMAIGLPCTPLWFNSFTYLILLYRYFPYRPVEIIIVDHFLFWNPLSPFGFYVIILSRLLSYFSSNFFSSFYVAGCLMVLFLPQPLLSLPCYLIHFNVINHSVPVTPIRHLFTNIF